MKIDSNFQTPMVVVKYMVSLIPKETVTILEPTPGIGNIVSQLSNYEVTAPEDFFLLEKQKYDCIIMNPPFSSKTANISNAPPDVVNMHKGMRLGYWFLLEAMKRSNHIIALMPWFTISDSDVRLRRIKSFGLKSLTALPRKTFKYARIQTVILELEKDYKKETVFKVFELLTTNNQFNLYESKQQ